MMFPQGEELQTSNRKLMREKVELHHALEEQEEQISSLQKESHKLQHQNQQLQSQVRVWKYFNWSLLTNRLKECPILSCRRCRSTVWRSRV